MADDEFNQIEDQYSSIQSELARLNESIGDIKTHLEQDRKISQSRWVSNTGYILIGLGIAALGIAATLQDSATTIISGMVLLIVGMALQSVSAFLYPKGVRKSKYDKSQSINAPLDINRRITIIGLTALAIIFTVITLNKKCRKKQ